MDRIYNNEFLAACIVIAILKTGITDITLLTVCLTLVMDDKLRNKFVVGETFQSYAKRIVASTDSKINNKYKDYLILFTNTIVILSQNDAVEINGKDIILTDIGESIYSHNIIDIPSNRLKDILKAIPHLCNSIAKCDINEVFYKLNIGL